MLDFSFLHDKDVITVNNKSELDSLLVEFESAGICWFGGEEATTKQLRDSLKETIKYIRFYEPNFIAYGTLNPLSANSLHRIFNKAIYPASEVLKLRYSESLDSDFEPLGESDLREFLSL